MKEARLDHELERIHKKLTFLWENYDFHVKYFTRDYGIYHQGVIIGLGNDVCKLVFQKETNSSIEPFAEYMGKKRSHFAPPNHAYLAVDGWYPLDGLIYSPYGVQNGSDTPVDQDLEHVSQYLKLHIDQLIDLFKYPKEFDRKLEYQRNLHKGNQISV
jgi:hypothetical protein